MNIYWYKQIIDMSAMVKNLHIDSNVAHVQLLVIKKAAQIYNVCCYSPKVSVSVATPSLRYWSCFRMKTKAIL